MGSALLRGRVLSEPSATPPPDRPSAPDGPGPPDRIALQRRTLRVLLAAQVFGGCGFFLGVAVAALLARDVGASDAASGLPLALGVITAALAAAPIAGWMAKVGRRPGLAAGHLCAAAGAGVVLLAAGAESFLLLCLGTAMFAVANTSNLLARYAATDLSEPARRARAISAVLLATAAGAVLGPSLASATEPLAEGLGLTPNAGPFVVSIAAFAVAAAIILVLLRPDPLLVSRALERAAPAPAAGDALPQVSLRDLSTWPPLALAGVAAMAVANVAMIAVMTMAPLHMSDAGESLGPIGLVISLHVAGMYLPSPVTGWLADRFGRLPVIAAGGVTLMGAGALAAVSAGDQVPLIAAALILLGVGWNFGLIGGSALLTDAVAPAHRPRAQGAADLVMGLAGATGSLAAGPVFHAGAFGLLGLASAGLGILVLSVAARARRLVPSPT